MKKDMKRIRPTAMGRILAEFLFSHQHFNETLYNIKMLSLTNGILNHWKRLDRYWRRREI